MSLHYARYLTNLNPNGSDPHNEDSRG